MKKVVFGILAGSVIASGAFAGSVEPILTVDAEPIALPATAPWAGLYAGAMASSDSGTMDYSDQLPFYYDLEGPASFGAFVGYNVQNGSFVYGGELAVSSGGYFPEGFPDEASPYIMDLKVRVGYAAGNALLYGAVGGSVSTWTSGQTFDVQGLALGVGVDFLVSDELFVGIEYLTRDMSGAGDDDPSQIGHVNIDSIQLRVGWNF